MKYVATMQDSIIVQIEMLTFVNFGEIVMNLKLSSWSRRDYLKFLNFVPVPGPPGPIKFTNITMHQLTVNFIPPAVTNGIVLLYEMEYFPVPKDPCE